MRRGRPARKLFKRVPRQGSTAPFTKASRHVALCRVLLARLSSGQASKQLAALHQALYEDDGSVDCRAPCAHTIQRWIKQLALEARVEARAPPGAVPRLTPQEKVKPPGQLPATPARGARARS